MHPAYIKEKMPIAPVYRPFTYNFLVYFFERQVHKKKNKLEIMTNVSKSHLYKHSQNV